MGTDSKNCCTLPAVVTTDYEANGTYVEVGDLRAYVTGDQSSTKGIIDIYDAFGLASQTIQGADRLAASLKAVVVMPDYFKGSPAQNSWFAADTEEKKEALAKFRARSRSPENYPMVMQSVADAEAKWPSVEAWGVVGLCCGGKLAARASGQNTPFKVSAQTHPGNLAKEDAEAMTIPHICLASKDEPANVVKEYIEIFSGEGRIGEIETYSTMFHGWMGARANLQDEENAKEFERGYDQIASFFAKYL